MAGDLKSNHNFWLLFNLNSKRPQWRFKLLKRTDTTLFHGKPPPAYFLVGGNNIISGHTLAVYSNQAPLIAILEINFTNYPKSTPGPEISWSISQLMDDDHLRVMEKEGYVEGPDPEVFKSPIRKSSRLQNKKSMSSCSKYVSKSYHSNCKYTVQPSKASPNKEPSVSESKIQEEKEQQFSHRNEINGVLSTTTVSMKSSTAVPSFQYHVHASEGIRLVVDLNLKRSDWLKSMEKAVCACQNHSKPASESFRKEVEHLGDRNNLKLSSTLTDKTSALDASMNSSVAEKEVITVSGSKRCSSKVDQNSELVLESSGNFEEVQLSDISSSQKGSLCSRTGKVCSENLVSSTTEVNQEADGNHRWSTVENEAQKRTSSAEEMEMSGREENAFVISAASDGPKRKKRCYKNDHIHSESHDRVLRSTLGGKILERDGVIMWRSSRLHSKRSSTTGYIYK